MAGLFFLVPLLMFGALFCFLLQSISGVPFWLSFGGLVIGAVAVGVSESKKKEEHKE
jgi:membrane associated rhomboid family serine protease